MNGAVSSLTLLRSRKCSQRRGPIRVGLCRIRTLRIAPSIMTEAPRHLQVPSSSEHLRERRRVRVEAFSTAQNMRS